MNPLSFPTYLGPHSGFGVLELHSSPRKLSQKFHSRCKPNDVQSTTGTQTCESKIGIWDSFEPHVMRIFSLRKQAIFSLTKNHKPHREQILGTQHQLHEPIAPLHLHQFIIHVVIASIFQNIHLLIQACQLQLTKRLLCGQTSSQPYTAVFICKVDLLLGWMVFLFISDMYAREYNQEISID